MKAEELEKHNPKVVTFKNEHGEEFRIYNTGSPFMPFVFAGHETDWEVTPLFGNFIWNTKEVRNVAEALLILTEEK